MLITNQDHRKIGDISFTLIQMEKLIFLIESDDSLRENITELLELDGYKVTLFTSGEVTAVPENCREGLVIFNALTLNEPAHEFIKRIKGKVSGIAVLCSDDEDPHIDEADIKITLPFSDQEFLKQLSDFIDVEVYQEYDSRVYRND